MAESNGETDEDNQSERNTNRKISDKWNAKYNKK